MGSSASSESDSVNVNAINSLITAIAESRDTSADMRSTLMDIKETLLLPYDILPDVITDVLAIINLIIIVGVSITLYNNINRIKETKMELREGKL